MATNPARLAPLVVALSAIAGLLGFWQGLHPLFLLVLAVQLPGYVMRTRLGAASLRGPAVVAVDFVFGLFLLGLAIAPVAALGGDWTAVLWLLAGVYLALATSALSRGRALAAEPKDEARAGWATWAAAAAALAALMPTVLSYAGGKVDDWWDLAFIRAHAEAVSFSFLQPVLTGQLVHPRFSWNLWWLLQSFLSAVSGADPVALQPAVMPPLVCALSVSAMAVLAGALFARGSDSAVARPQQSAGLSVQNEIQIALLVMPLWLYGTEAFPYFTRLHQDKFAAILVAAPVTLALLLAALRNPSPMRTAAVFVAAAVTCSLHAVVYGYLLVLGGAIVLACVGRHGLRAHSRIVFALALPMLFPLWQAYSISGLFSAQGIELANDGNPVVRAHIWLDRLLGVGSVFYIVKPSAAFGAVALVAVPGVLVAWQRRGRFGMRAVLVLALLPCSVAFVPGVAALAGRVFVPWMVYRILWYVPVAVLTALVFSWAASRDGGRRVTALALVVLITGLAVAPTAADRMRRGMAARPFERPSHPEGTTLETYEFLRAESGIGAVLAPSGFSELVAAMSGRPSVAISERGTLVFSSTETDAYQRLRDRATFFASATGWRRRAQIADRYGAGYAVFRKTMIAAGSEPLLLRRYSAEGLLLRTKSKQSPTRADSIVLPPNWRRVFENQDFVVARRDGGAAATTKSDVPVDPSVAWSSTPAWLEVFDLNDMGTKTADRPHISASPPPADRLLASLVGQPGGDIHLDPVPLAIGNADTPVWTPGAALWDDGPDEVAVDLGFGTACVPTRIDVVPYLRKSRREVWELRVLGRTTPRGEFTELLQGPLRARAVDGHPITIELAGAEFSGSLHTVRVQVRSMLGRPFGIADVRVFGERSTCLGTREAAPRGPMHAADLSALLAMAADFPYDARPAIAVHRRLLDAGNAGDADAFLTAALLRDPTLANGLVELGLARDRAGRLEEATGLFRRAVREDSNNAWAYGCLAWAQQRRGNPVAALWQAKRAIKLDERYADAWTIKGIAERTLGLSSTALSSLRRSVRLDPRRDWGAHELAATLAGVGRHDDARRVLRRFLVHSPGRSETLTRLAALDAQAVEQEPAK